jgi:hypothetical protein
LYHEVRITAGGVADPKFVAEFREQPLERANRPRGFDPHAHRPLQIQLERLGFAAGVIHALFG